MESDREENSWNHQPIGTFCDVVRGSTPRPARDPRYFNGGFLPWVTVAELTRNDAMYLTQTSTMLTKEGSKHTRIFEPNTLLLTNSGATLGVPKILRIQAGANDGIAAFLNIENACSRFLFYVLQQRTEFMRSRLAPGVGQPNLNTDIIASIIVPIPPIEEQREIAAILSTWDRAIELTEKLIAAKHKRKHALMQKLLTGEQDRWPVRKLGTVFENQKSKGQSGLPTFSVTLDDGLVLRETLERKTDTTLKPEEHLLIEQDDIAYNMMRMWQGASGLAPESGLVSPAYVVVRTKGEIDPLFASYWFKAPRVVKKFQDYSHGLTKDRLRLYFKDFASIQLPIPPIDLQRKFASALTACDRELSLFAQKAELLKQQKKGLMQQLLTGKTRVKVAAEIA